MKKKKKRIIGHLPIKTHPSSILRVPTTQLAKMSIDLKSVELTADVLEKNVPWYKIIFQIVFTYYSRTRYNWSHRVVVPGLEYDIYIYICME